MTKKQFFIQVVAFVLAWVALPFLLACDKGCENHNGVCACDQLPVADTTPQAKPSDEKPPQDKMPSYQREGIHADMPASTAIQDAELDREKQQADFEGKKAAGL